MGGDQHKEKEWKEGGRVGRKEEKGDSELGKRGRGKYNQSASKQ